MLEKKVVELADRLEAALKTAAPDVIESASRAIFAAGLSNLLVTSIIGIGLLLLGRWLLKQGDAADDYCNAYWYLCAIAALIAGVATWLGGWLTLSNWLAVFDQKSWLALKMIEKLGM